MINRHFFQCDPVKYSCHTACCSNSRSHPSVSLGDYVRMAASDNMDVADIAEFWLVYGNINLDPQEPKENRVYQICLGLLHDPCVFLAVDSTCMIHQHRPPVCALFPYALCAPEQAQHREQYLDEYPCLRDAYVNNDTLYVIKKIAELVIDEQNIQKRIVIELPLYDLNKLLKVMSTEFEQAFNIQQKWPQLDSKRHQHLVQAFESFGQVRQAMDAGKVVDINQLEMCVRPVLYTQYRDVIRDYLTTHAENIQNAFQDTTVRYYCLLDELNTETSKHFPRRSKRIMSKKTG